jgi:putative ABC transport system permease protein
MRLVQDGAYALRMIVKSPGFAAVAVITIALGIGVNTTLFSVANLVLRDRSTGMKNPRELFVVWGQVEAKKGAVGNGLGFAPFSDYFEYREATDAFDLAVARAYPVKMVWQSNTALAGAQVVSGNYFDVIGVTPAMGRDFRRDESEGTSGPAVVIVSHDAWQRRLDGARDVLGRSVKLNGQPFTIIGVNPKGFPSPDFSVPTASYDQLFPADAGALLERGRVYCPFTGRLKPGVSLEQAQARITSIAARLAAQYPATNKGTTARLLSAESGDPDQRRSFLFVVGAFLALGGMVLLVACGNVCNLLLARAQARRREMAIRSALGASCGQLVRQLLTESVLLALLGGVLGLLLAHWTQILITHWWWPDLDVRAEPRLVIDRVAVGYAALLLLLSTVAFGLLPALRLSSLDLVAALKGKSTDGTRGGRLSAGLVMAQVAAAFVLLIISGLLVRSMRAAQSADLGFDPRNVLTARMDLSFESYPKATWPALFEQIQAQLAALPGAVSASVAQGLPVTQPYYTMYSVEGVDDGTEARQQSWFTNVDSLYLRTLGIPLLEGRDIQRTDDPDHRRVALVNKSFADHYWPGRSALGHVVTLDGNGGKPVQIVGVFGDMRFGRFTDASARIVFLSLYQTDQPQLSLLVRTAHEPELLAGPLRETVKKIDPDMLLLDVLPYEESLGRNAFFIFRVGAVFAAALAALALILAVVGLYGLLAFTVSQKTREIGVRMALGADSRHVVWLFVRRGLLLTATGLAVGFLGAFAIKRLITEYLYGISAMDPGTFLTVPVLFTLVALLASYLPARRATKVDPMEALRSE